MSNTRMTTDGRLTIPGRVRHRWGTRLVALDDHGDHLVVRPVNDPIDGFIGFAASVGTPRSEDLRAANRLEERRTGSRRS